MRAIVRALEREPVEVVARSRRVDEVARDHRVDVDAAEHDAFAAQRDRRELQIVADFLDRRSPPARARVARTPRAPADSACPRGPCAPRARSAPCRASSQTPSRRSSARTADVGRGERGDADAAGRADLLRKRVDLVERRDDGVVARRGLGRGRVLGDERAEAERRKQREALLAATVRDSAACPARTSRARRRECAPARGSCARRRRA